MRKILLIVVLIIIIGVAYVLLGDFFTGNFEQLYSKLQSIEAKYGVNEVQLTPGTEAELDEFENELKQFENSLGENRDEKAIKLLIASRLDLIAMERNFLLAKDKIDAVDPLHPDCSLRGNITQAKEFFDEVIERGRVALEKRKILLNNYPVQAQKAGITSNEGLEYAINGLADSVEFTKETLGSYCP